MAWAQFAAGEAWQGPGSQLNALEGSNLEAGRWFDVGLRRPARSRGAGRWW